MKVHHTGIISNSVEKDLLIYEKLGYKVIGEIMQDFVQNNKLLFLQDIFKNVIELIEPLNENSTVKNSKTGVHHICYEVDSIDNAIAMIREKKLGSVFTKPLVASGLENRKIVFVFLKTGMIIEFLESGVIAVDNR